MMRNLIFALTVFSATFISYGAKRPQPIRTDNPTQGVNIVTPEENTWRSRSLDMPSRPGDDDRIEREGDFFEIEYGKPLEAFSFTNGWNRLWGASKNDPDLPAIAFAKGWGEYVMCQWAIVADVEQNLEESSWDFFSYTGRSASRKKIKFSTPGKKRSKCFIPMGIIRFPSQIKGFKFICTESNKVAGTIHSLKLVSYKVPVEYRRKFTLAEKPALAGVSVCLPGQSKLIVNGEVAARGVNVRGQALLHYDITKFMKPGANEVVVEKDAAVGWGVNTMLSIELFTVDNAGVVSMWGGDKDWECRYNTKPWKKVRLGGKVGFYNQPNRNLIQYGVNPMHAGPLQVKPHGEEYPVFDCDGRVAWNIWFPGGVKDPRVKAEVKDAFTGKVVETRELEGADKKIFDLTTRATGAYEVHWKLLSGEKEIDAFKTEMVVAGPIAGRKYPLEEMEKELARRKKLLFEIDPTDEKWFNVSSNFIAHSGMFGTPRVEMGKTVTECGKKMRQTGESDGCYFAWHIPVGKLGNAHIVEIDYPDTRKQVIYSTVSETYPYPFINNGGPYDNGHANATGSVKTGDREPLTGKIKTLRYVFFPGSKNTTVTFESGLEGFPAVCSAIRIYEVPEGLPAWDAPKTDRVFMNHNERPLFGIWGAHVTPAVYSSASWPNLQPRMWAGAFAAAANRISQLRFEGHNASVEGVYMYTQGFPTTSGESHTCQDNYDFIYLIAKMYRHNGIKFYAGFEYLASPKLSTRGAFDVSEREMWKGNCKSPAHLVDANGRITVGFGGMGLNDRHPAVRESITNLVTEIYNRYSKIKGIDGMFLISGGWWLPGLTLSATAIPSEMGFDDDTIAEFERETGISLGTGVTGRERFKKRHELLTGKYSDRWRTWRAYRMRSAFEEIHSIINSKDAKWKFYASTGVRYKIANPFSSLDSTPYLRDTFHADVMKDSWVDPSIYGAKSDTPVNLVPTLSYSRDMDYTSYGIMMNKGARALYRRNDALYFMPKGLNERNCSTGGLKGHPWWWTRTVATVYDVKFSGDAAYGDLVDVVNEYTPRMLVHTWTDVNLCTAHDAALRNFLDGYYRTPLGDGEAYCGVKGATARIYGGKLQLVNNTPYEATGTIEGVGKVTLRPYAIKVLDKPGKGEFRFAPEVEKEISENASKILSDEGITSRIRPDYLARLKAARNDAYRACVLMRDWEVGNVRIRKEISTDALTRQARLVEMLEKEGSARVNCGSMKDITDERGRSWLQDQRYTGFGAYGNEFANLADRGPIPIANTDVESIYRTEGGCAGTLVYHVPVPEGTYDVILHFAETWDTLPGRIMEATVCGETKTVIPWDAGGRYAASHTIWKGVKIPANGEVLIKIIKGPPILNGIEIKKK